MLSNAGQIVDRMSELKSLYHDVMKNDADRESYNKEFRDLQVQLFDMSRIKFNGVISLQGTRLHQAIRKLYLKVPVHKITLWWFT